MSTLKILYPQSNVDTVAAAITVASLASDTNLLAGRESDVIDNRTNLDIDHLVGGWIKLGTSPTASRVVEVWAFAPLKGASGTFTYPDVMDGTDSNETITSANVKAAGWLKQVASMTTDATTGLVLPFGPVSIRSLFGAMPPLYGLFVVHSSGVNLDSTAGNHYIGYQRIQAQSV